MKKLENILLIDDSDADNEYHRMVLEDAEIANHIKTITDSRKALNCWQNKCGAFENLPDLIFLDINMPALNGFELLDRICETPGRDHLRNKLKVIMLSGTINPDDQKLATGKYAHIIAGFVPKPLSSKAVQAILQKYF